MSADRPKPYDDALHAITTIGGYTNNADTKIGLLAGALTVLTGTVVRQRQRVETLLDGDVGVRAALALIALFLCAVLLVVAGAWLLNALRPRLNNDLPSRFAFPHLATATLQELVEADPVRTREEAWIQAQTLACIVLRKYECFYKALKAGVPAGLLLVAWHLLVPLP